MSDEKSDVIFAPWPARDRGDGEVRTKQDQPKIEPRRAVNIGAQKLCEARRGSVTRDAARNGRSIRPGFPAFADRLCITVDVDVSYAVDALLHRFGRIFVLFLYRFEERPKKRQRKKAPVHASKRRLHLDFPFFGSRGVTNGQSNGETDGECAENGRHRVLAQEEFRSLSSMTCLFFRLFPGIACRSRDFASRLPETLPRTRSNLLFAGWQRGRQRFIFHKIVAV